MVKYIFIIEQIFNDYIQSAKSLYAFFIDYSEAFDYVVRDNLWYKLMQYGINGKILKIIMSMYASIKSKIKYGDYDQ